MILGLTGATSTIAKSFVDQAGDDIEELHVARSPLDLLYGLDTYLLCAGVLYGKKANKMTEVEAATTLNVNYLDIVKFCDTLFNVNKKAKVCVIGSQSGIKGSYDTVYAGSKAALHLYVETKTVTYPDQHLVAVAPTIIEDSGMTQRREDLVVTRVAGEGRRLGRWLKAEEVARIAHFALREPALCNTVISATGGNW